MKILSTPSPVRGRLGRIKQRLLERIYFNFNVMRILFTGGGTMGSVTPLLAVAEKIKKVEPTTEFFWIGTEDGPEKILIEEYGIIFATIKGGKLRRYFSLNNLIDPFKILVGYFQSLGRLRKIRPEIVISAGAFISVPVVWAAWLLKIPVIVHQQDVIPGLANKLMAPFAKKITTALDLSLKYFKKGKAVQIGNPVRESVLTGSREVAMEKFGLTSGLPVLLVIGGGTGSEAINNLVFDSVNELTGFCQTIHVTGHGKMNAEIKSDNYHPYEFITEEMKDAMAVADLVVSRAGFGFLTELAALGKPTIVIPMPGTHQEANAKYFARSNSVIYLDQRELDSSGFVATVKSLLSNKSDLANLSRNIKTALDWDASEEMVKLINELTGRQ